MTMVLPQLPYELSALEPYVSARTLEFHHGKHHQAYVANLNQLISGTFFENLSLEEIILQSAQKTDKESVFNNAAQAWNYTFFWMSMTPDGGRKPSAEILSLIHRDFGSIDQFRDSFKKAALSQFGSGWVWLVQDESGCAHITKTSNADLPLAYQQKPLLCCDLWEHAYYLDYQNRRGDFIDVFLTHLINWDFASANLLSSKA